MTMTIDKSVESASSVFVNRTSAKSEESVKSVVLKYTGVLLKHKSGRLEKAYLTV